MCNMESYDVFLYKEKPMQNNVICQKNHFIEKKGQKMEKGKLNGKLVNTFSTPNIFLGFNINTSGQQIVILIFWIFVFSMAE